MLPPPITMPTWTPISTRSRTSWAICSSVLGEMPYLPSPISASPLSLRRMRLNRGGLDLGPVTGRGRYLATLRWSRTARRPSGPPHCPRLVRVLGQWKRRIGGQERARRDVDFAERLQLVVHGGGLVAELARS